MPRSPRVESRWRMRGTHAVATIVAVALTTVAWQARAATFTVNSNADTTDGVCGPAVGECTLREAIEDAVATPGRDTIAFDPAVFPRTPLNFIALTSELPVIADPAGTVIDGAGATVVVSGGQTVQRAFLFASAPGVPLRNVTVANVLAGSFTGTAVHICGGSPPQCDDDVAGAVVRNVNVIVSGEGIRIEGNNVTKARVVDSVVTRVDGSAIRLFAEDSIVKAQVERSRAFRSDNGIALRASNGIVGATIVDSSAVRCTGNGFSVSAQDVANVKLTNVLASGNGDFGIQVRADATTAGVKITDSVATGNGDTGIAVSGDAGATAEIKNVVADDNGPYGIQVAGPGTGTSVTRAIAVENNGIGLGVVAGATGAKVTKVLAAANRTAHGLFLDGSTTVVQDVVASGNRDAGILLFSPGGGHAVTKSAFSGNNSGVIILDGGSGNVVEKNVALGNVFMDLFDQNAACDTNQWTENVFRTANETCIQ
jgi:CSLREA domain-containing protein